MREKTKAEILEELGGLPEAIYDQLTAKFKVISADQLDKLEEFIKAGNAQEAGNLAHSMKGAAANLRLNAIYTKALALEKDIKETFKPDGALNKINALRKLVDKI